MRLYDLLTPPVFFVSWPPRAGRVEIESLFRCLELSYPFGDRIFYRKAVPLDRIILTKSTDQTLEKLTPTFDLESSLECSPGSFHHHKKVKILFDST